MSTKKVICSYIDIAHVSDILSVKDQIVSFRENKEWTRLNAKSKIVYQSQLEIPNAGSIMLETVTVNVDSADALNLQNGKEYYVLCVHAGMTELIVGSLEYPAKKTFSSDGVRTTFTFTCVSPEN